MACGILVLLIAAIAASTNGYGSKDYYSGNKEDYSYKPKVVKSSSYSSSSYVSHGHHAGYAGHKLITGHAYKFKVGRIFKRFHNLGVKLIGRGIRYNGFYYGRLCSATKLYGALNSCYEDYGDIGDCFPGLIKQGLIGRRHVYHKYGHGFGLGVTFVRRGIVYGRSYYKYGCRRSKFIRYMTSCYNKFHHASTCVSVLRKRHLIRSPHSYHGHMHLSGYTRFRRFKISHGRFRYGGKYYKLSCSKRRFYSYWNRCYGRYHSVGRCFGYLRRKHLFSYYNGYSSGGYGAGYRSGHGGIVYDYGYYKSHHGFSIHHNRFTYGGIAYRLKCSRSRFYRHWGQCYHRYHSVGICFDRLRSLHLFYRYVGATHAILNKHLYHHRRIANNHARRIHNVAKSHVARISHVSNKHIHNIQHQANKHVSRIASVARSHMNRFKQLVDYHLRRLHKHTKYHLSSVEHQHKKHLNERQYQNNKHELNVRHLHKKHEYYLKKHGYRYGHGHSLIHHRFSHGGKGHAYRFHVGRIFNRFHRLGVELIGRGIRYNGFYYGRLCSSTKLYGALNSCYEDYGDIGDCFPGLIKQGLIGRRHVYHKYGHGFGLGVTFVKRGIVYGRSYYKFGCRRSKFIRYMTSCYNKFHHASTCVSVLRKRHLIGSPHSYHGHMHLAGYTRFRRFKISHGRFRYGGKYYKLSCSKRRFYSYWNRCYGRYHSVGRCFGYLRRKHLFSYYNAGYSSVTHSAYGAGYSSGITYDFAYYKSHHGFTIRNNQFTYGGIGYKLKCGRSRFYRLWGQCYHRYHSVGSCFGRLHRQHLFYRYGGEDYSEIGYSSGPIYDRSYYYSHHGFRIRHHRFSYNGIAYKLKCSRSRFYRHWGQCYHRYHSVGTCFRRLGRHHLFYRYVRHHHALRKHLYRHRQIAHHHTRRIHRVAKSHVARISHVSNKHVRHIQHQANKHVSRIANEARSHINRFKQLVDYHVKRLHKHTKHHLSTVEHQHKRHLNTRQYQNKKHELNVRHLHKKHEYNLKKHSYAYRHRHSHRHVRYIDYYKKYHGFKIRQHRFSYGGKAYQLACGDKRFWRYWSHCYSHYHSRSVCFGKLKKRRLFDLYTDGYDEEDGYEPAVKEKVY
ncbi:uncharacterized protein [Mytilus edulis]|uniref:uncharacterized protein isoform X2 n=2 Tax=Mytilus edulis TaxID=6550 RepID=UPI0039F0F2E3